MAEIVPSSGVGPVSSENVTAVIRVSLTSSRIKAAEPVPGDALGGVSWAPSSEAVRAMRPARAPVAGARSRAADRNPDPPTVARAGAISVAPKSGLRAVGSGHHHIGIDDRQDAPIAVGDAVAEERTAGDRHSAAIVVDPVAGIDGGVVADRAAGDRQETH